jgi:hypothetical protein
MKKLLFLIIILLLTACNRGGAMPSDTVVTFFEHLIAGEFTEAEDYIIYAEDEAFTISDIEEEYRVLFSQLTYRNVTNVINVSESANNRASVRINLTAVDFITVMDETMAEALVFIYAGVTEEELFDIIEDLIRKKITAENAPKTNVTIIADLEKDGGDWKIAANFEFLNAITGGLLEFAGRFGMVQP